MNITRSGSLFRHVLLLLLAALALTGCFRVKPPTDAADALNIGKHTLGRWVIDGDELAHMHPGLIDRRPPKAWTGPTLKLPAGGPYTVVVFLEGRANGPGRSIAVYSLAYEGLQSSKLPAGATITAAPRFGDESQQAGERTFSKVWVGSPLRWETDQQVALQIGFDEIKQLQPTKMTVILRGGSGGLGLGWVTAGIPVLTGLVMIGLWFFWFRR